MSGADAAAASAASTDVTASTVSTDAAVASVDAASADAAVATPDAAAAGDAVGGDTAAAAPAAAHSFACLRRQCLEARATAQLEARACKAPPSQFFHLDAAGKVCFSAGTLGSALGLALCLHAPTRGGRAADPVPPQWCADEAEMASEYVATIELDEKVKACLQRKRFVLPQQQRNVALGWQKVHHLRHQTRAPAHRHLAPGTWHLAPSSRRLSSHHTWDSAPNELQSRLRQCSRAMLLRRPLPCCRAPAASHFPRRWRRASATRRCTVR